MFDLYKSVAKIPYRAQTDGAPSNLKGREMSAQSDEMAGAPRLLSQENLSYSQRKAAAGSILAARSAGPKVARRATTKKASKTEA